MPKVEQEPDPRRRVPGIDGVAAGAGDGCVGQAVMLDIAKWNIVQAFEMVFPLQAYKCVKQYLQDPTFFATKVTFSAVWCTFTFIFCGICGFFLLPVCGAEVCRLPRHHRLPRGRRIQGGSLKGLIHQDGLLRLDK